jgi:hypothetical protein
MPGHGEAARSREVADTILSYRRVGFDTFILEPAALYNDETMSTLINVVKPMVESASVFA